MSRWRHLGLGLAGAKERLALTVLDVTRRTFVSAHRRRDADNLLYRTRLFGHKIDDSVCWGARSETTRQDAPRSTIGRGATPWIPPA